MQVLYVADALSRWQVEAETTPLMVREARRRGAVTFTCTGSDLGFDGATPVARVAEITPRAGELGFELGEVARRPLADFDVIHLRVDPPFDRPYYFLTLVLEAAAATGVLVINDPVAVRSHNEKLAALLFPELTCETLVSADPTEIAAFTAQVGGRAVLKPLYRCSGQGVQLLEGSDQEVSARAAEALSEHGSHVLVQRFLPAVLERGETRLTVIGGEVAGWMCKTPQQGSILANLDFGAKVSACDYTDKEARIMAQVGPFLSAHGLHLAAVDTIDGHLTEINITSPGLLHEMNQINGSRLEVKLEDLIQQLVR